MQYVLISVAIMAVVTYLPRMLPLAIFKKKITNPWVKSFLAYVPYAVLAAMTFPAILYATSSYSALAGLLVALVLAYYNKSLLVVALASTGVVFVVEQLLQVMGWA